MKYEKVNSKIRALILKNSLIARVKEVRNVGISIYNKMDDWIIFSLKQENDIVLKYVRSMQKSIADKEISNLQPIVISPISVIH